MAHIEAKALDQRRSLYANDAREWEHCEGTEGLTYFECQTLVKEWRQSEKDDFGMVVTLYRIIV